MSVHEVIAFDDRLFARKGEALPSGGKQRSFAPNAAAADQSDDGSASPLSFLIQRRSTAPAREQDHSATVTRLKATTASPVQADSRPPRRKLTLRLDYAEFGRLRSLVDAWDATYQSVLQEAVRHYFEDVDTSVSVEADASNRLPNRPARS